MYCAHALALLQLERLISVGSITSHSHAEVHHADCCSGGGHYVQHLFTHSRWALSLLKAVNFLTDPTVCSKASMHSWLDDKEQ